VRTAFIISAIMEAVRTSVTSVSVKETKRRYIPDQLSSCLFIISAPIYVTTHAEEEQILPVEGRALLQQKVIILLQKCHLMILFLALFLTE
jgi:hypothetical protein